jgi:Asp-tRNA(Asn)/Glu-tRNA(Gln) amidotransferase A subunit family amidase
VEKPASYLSLMGASSLQGKKIGVPRLRIQKAKPTHVSQEVLNLWHRARADLESLGARIVETDFPLVTNYEDDSESSYPNNVEGCPASWFGKERGEIISYAWDDFLSANGDPSYPHLGAVNPAEMFPKPEGYIPDMFVEAKNLISYPDIVSFIKDGRRAGKTIVVEDMPQVLEALEPQRQRDLEIG